MKTIMERLKMWKRRQIISVILIVCLLGSVVLSDHIYGVFATTDPVENLLNGGEYASPSNAGKKNHKNQNEDNWEYASSSNASHSNADWSDASPSNASPSNALEYEQLTLEDDSEPVTVSGKLPVGTRLIAELIPEEELLECGMEELELETASVAFAYRITLWLNGVLYQPEYNLTVSAENMDLLDGELNLIQLETDEQDQITGYHTVPCSISKEGIVSFTMTKLGFYAAIDMGNPEKVQTITDADGHVMISGEFPETITVTAETLSENVLSQMELPEGDITFAYDVKLWKNEKEYKPEKPVKVTLLNPENAVDVQAQSLDAENESETEASTENADQENRITLFSVATDEQGMLTEKQTVEDSADEAGNLSFVTEQVAAYVGVEQQTVNADIAALIDADIALLKWKATHEAETSTEADKAITVTINGTSYDVSDDSSYQVAYDTLYPILQSNAITITDTLEGKKITDNTIWNISGTVTMTGNVTVAANQRLVILGDGTIQKTASCGIVSYGTVALQGKVFLDGNNNADNLLKVIGGVGFLTDEFHLGNNGAAGVSVSNSTFYMSGGLIGTRDVTFDWYDEEKKFITNRTYNETLAYIENGLGKDTYDYIIPAKTTGGCVKHGLYVDSQGTYYMNGGEIAGNGQAQGGGCEIDGLAFITGGLIMGNTASYCGGMYVTGTVDMSGGKAFANHATTFNGGIDVRGTFNLKGTAIVAYNSCMDNGGGITVEGTGKCTLSEKAQVTHNTAIGKFVEKNFAGGTGNGGGFRVVGTLTVNGGMISYNQANGRIEECPNSLNAGHGGGINAQTDGDKRVAGIKLNGGTIENNKARINGGGVYVTCIIPEKAASFSMENTVIQKNYALGDGGGVYLSARRGILEANINSGTVQNNIADGSGGGCYVELGEYKPNASGNTLFAQSIDVSIGAENKDGPAISRNTASENGGGICVARSENNTSPNDPSPDDPSKKYGIYVNLNNGTLQANQANNGGAISVQQGSFTMPNGQVKNNIAHKNGGGIYVTDGDVKIYNGTIAENKAETAAGGGLFVKAEKSGVDVKMLSGTLSSNNAKTVGGGMAVESLAGELTTMTVGVCREHQKLNYTDRTFTPFSYLEHTHDACPLIQDNTAEEDGGGLFLSGANSKLNLYCLKETGNTATNNTKSCGMKVEGGSVVIGDPSKKDGDYEKAFGNVWMENSVLVKGGTVDAYGNMQNPYFAGQITVDVEKTGDQYTDWRGNLSKTDIDYKIHYYENFAKPGEEASGLYYAKQYQNGAKIQIEPAMFNHPGWRIVGWNTKRDGTGKTYSASEEIILNDTVVGMDKTKHQLTLWAIWEQCLYTIVFVPNAPLEVAYTGTMLNQACTVGEQVTLSENQYKCIGYEFSGWNLKLDGNPSGNYSDAATIEGLSSVNGSTIKLYAQWTKCNHTDSAKLQYTFDQEKNALIQTCACGNHTAYASLSAENITYDGIEHPISIRYEGDLWQGEKPVVTYKRRNLGVTASYESMEGIPKNAGEYQATVTAGETIIDLTYEIGKAVQEAPTGSLQYEYNAENNTLTIRPLNKETAENGYHGKPEYKIERQGNESSAVYSENNEFTLEQEQELTQKYYKLYARYAETDNYRASDEIEAGLYLTNSAMVRFKLDPGISVKYLKTNTDTGYVYQVTIEKGYHKDHFQGNAVIEGASSSGATCQLVKVTKEDADEEKDKVGQYILTVSGTSSTGGSAVPVLVTFTGVKPDTTLSASAKAGQYFQDLEDAGNAGVSINADSAFTAQFDVKNWNTGDYMNPSLTFDSSIPAGTTIIMQTEQDYWFYKTTNPTNSISLSAFLRMGDSSNSKYSGTVESGYRFVVDFSQAAEWTSGNNSENRNLTMQLRFEQRQLENTENTIIPELTAAITIAVSPAFTISGTVSTSEKGIGTLTLDETSSEILKQMDENIGIKLTMNTSNSSEIPDDLCLVVRNGNKVTIYPLSQKKSFLVNLSELSKDGVMMYLQSSTFASEERQYSFAGQFCLLNSESEKNIMVVTKTWDFNSSNSFNLTIPETAQPSVKITAEKRLYQKGTDQEMDVQIEMSNMDDRYVKELSLLKKNDESKEFDTDTAYRDYVGAGSRSISLNGLETGSYCLKMTVSDEGRTILEVPYYFIITDASGQAA